MSSKRATSFGAAAVRNSLTIENFVASVERFQISWFVVRGVIHVFLGLSPGGGGVRVHVVLFSGDPPRRALAVWPDDDRPVDLQDRRQDCVRSPGAEQAVAEGDNLNVKWTHLDPADWIDNPHTAAPPNDPLGQGS